MGLINSQKHEVLEIASKTIIVILALIWAAYYIYGRQAVEWVYNNKEMFMAIINSIGDADKPLFNYFSRAPQLLYEISFILAAFAFMFYICSRQAAYLRRAFVIIISLVVLFAIYDFFSPLGLNIIDYCLIWAGFIFLSAAVFLLLNKADKKKVIFGASCAIVSVLISLAAAELMLFQFRIIVPDYPKYLAQPCRWDWPGLNSIGFLDKERVFKNINDSKRILFVGDSFLEIHNKSIVPVCEDFLRTKTGKNLEFINLSESNTDIIDYYWRLKNIGTRFNPDLVLIFIFEANDFIDAKRFRDGLYRNHFIAAYPQPSIFSRFFPRLTALLSKGRNYINGLKARPWIEPEKWNSLSGKEKETKIIELISRHMNISVFESRKYFNSLSSPAKSYIFSLKFLPSYYMNFIKGARPLPVLRSKYTAECIARIKKDMMKKDHAPDVKVFFIPAGEKVDPELLAVLQDLYNINGLPFGQLLGEDEYRKFCNYMSAENIEIFNLKDVLNGVSGAYSLDGHWNDLGMRLASEYICAKLINAPVLKE